MNFLFSFLNSTGSQMIVTMFLNLIESLRTLLLKKISSNTTNQSPQNSIYFGSSYVSPVHEKAYNCPNGIEIKLVILMCLRMSFFALCGLFTDFIFGGRRFHPQDTTLETICPRYPFWTGLGTFPFALSRGSGHVQGLGLEMLSPIPCRRENQDGIYDNSEVTHNS